MADVSLVQRAAEAEAASYALDCLVLIGRRFGLDLTVERLVKDNALPSAEVSTEQFLLCAERAGFRCRSLTVKWSALSQLRTALPAIVRFADNRHAVLLRLDGEADAPRLVLDDPTAPPGSPPLVMDRAAFEAAWAGELILIKRSLAIKDLPEPFGLSTIVPSLLANRRLMRDLTISTLALSVLAFVPILFAQVMLTEVLSVPGAETFAFLCIGLAVLVFFEGSFAALRRGLLAQLGARLEHTLAGLAFERMLGLSMDYFETTPVGMITHRMAQVTTVATGLSNRAIATFLDLLLFVIAAPLLLYENMPLAFVVAGLAALIVGWVAFRAPRLRERAAAIEEVSIEQGAFVSQSIAGFSTIKSVGLDARLRQRWDILSARQARLRLEEGDAVSLVQTVVHPLERLMVFGTFLLGVAFSVNQTGGATLATLFAFLLITHRIAAPVRHIGTIIGQWDELRRGVALIAGLVDLPLEDDRAGVGVRLPVRGQIEFTNVSFEYPGALTPALDSVSFDVPLGTSLGIMGRSGAGKTTITRLLQRLHADYQGLIKIDGIDVREYDVNHLRSSVGVVLQDPFIFSGTIRDNIMAPRPDASMEEMTHAARMAGADEFIDRLPLGYDTALHEGAPDLSGGQRQRLAIARALIADPRILILDEATSALDAESEALVSANLKRLSHGRTLITISHRLSALANADSILVLDRGEVQDIGQHHELLERCDIYSGLWQRQKALLDAPSASERLLPKGSNVA